MRPRTHDSDKNYDSLILKGPKNYPFNPINKFKSKTIKYVQCLLYFFKLDDKSQVNSERNV